MKEYPSHIQNPMLNDFIYNVLFHASYEEKRGLKGHFLRACLNEASAKRFAVKSTKEEKEHILAHFGFRFFYVVDRTCRSFKEMKGVLGQFDVGNKAPALDKIVHDGMFIMSDKEVSRLSGIVSQAMGSSGYFLNLEFAKQGYHIQKWAKRNLNEKDLEARGVLDSARAIAGSCLDIDDAYEAKKNVDGIDRSTMKVLLYLYKFDKDYVPADKLGAYFKPRMKPVEYNKAIRKLYSEEYIIKHAKPGSSSYVISSRGIKAINSFFDIMFKK